ncbi:MAG: FecR domain-containing protein [Cyclobacteriaceae bacterium]|nr:FecR domain-containing protein [Cyclobacteriaceae bacterium HetDA_MAG_MS6]
MNYSRYTVEDFVKDEYFRQWVLSPNDKNKQFWESWLKRNPDKKEELTHARKIVSQFDFQTFHPTREEASEVWENILHLRGIDTEKTSVKVVDLPEKARQSFFRRVTRIAASIVLLLSLGVAVYLNQDLLIYQQYTTAYGEIETIVLPDHTEVVLNANSTLRKKRSWFDQGEREVWLTGEGHFHVAKKRSDDGTKVKFLVHTTDLDVEVLGTQFNVNTRREKTRVVLTEGKVKLDMEGVEDVFMNPGEMAEFSKTEEKLEMKRVNPVSYTSWKENKLIFTESTLQEIADLLGDEHGLDVILLDPALYQKKFQGTFEADKVDVLIQAIAISFDLEVDRRDNQVILK